MLYKYHLLLRTFAFAVAVGALALNVGAEETGHDHHDHHDHAASGDDDPHAHHRAMMNKPAEPAKSTEVELLDRVLVDQNGDEI